MSHVFVFFMSLCFFNVRIRALLHHCQKTFLRLSVVITVNVLIWMKQTIATKSLVCLAAGNRFLLLLTLSSPKQCLKLSLRELLRPSHHLLVMLLRPREDKLLQPRDRRQLLRPRQHPLLRPRQQGPVQLLLSSDELKLKQLHQFRKDQLRQFKPL